jgi:hypothetical protein
MNKTFKFSMIAGILGASSLPFLVNSALAQSNQPAASSATPAAAVAPVAVGAAPAAATITIPAMTPVIVEITADLSSKTSKTGEIFPLRLAAPITIDGHLVVPAGTMGEGEVLDAKHGGMAGSSGILMLIAHNLKVDGRTLRLRSMQVTTMGDDRTTRAEVAVALVGVFGMFVTGGETKIQAGTFAGAKTAEDFTLTLAPESPPVPAPVAPPAVSTTKGTAL